MPPTTPRSKGRTGRPWRRAAAYIKRTQNVCHICGHPIDKTLPPGHPQSFTVDHIEPLATNEHLARDRTNLKAAHLRCNASKGTKTLEQLDNNSQPW